MSFEAFPKIPRLSREIVVTEKIDGTNAQVLIEPWLNSDIQFDKAVCVIDGLAILPGSRTRWLETGKNLDNFGFARWVADHASELVKLGPGRHFGEWWGQGIQRGYGLKEKRFSLFNVEKWADPSVRPACCHVVPQLYKGSLDTDIIENILQTLAITGSLAAEGFKNPEGIIVYHTAARQLFKKTFDGDQHKEAA